MDDIKFQDIVDIPKLLIGEGITALLGGSGSGKTTVLKMLNKMLSPTQGQIRFKGQDLRQIPSVEHRRKVMMLSQNPSMFPGNIRDNLAIVYQFQERPVPADEDLIAILSEIQLDKELDMPVANLSGGEKQRLALARILLQNPGVYLLDEPSSALDDETEDVIIGMVSARARTAGSSIIMVTHSRTVAEKYADVIVEMAAGKITNRRIAANE